MILEPGRKRRQRVDWIKVLELFAFVCYATVAGLIMFTLMYLIYNG